MQNAAQAIRNLGPGILLSFIIAASATFVSEHQGGPALLYALLFGMALKSAIGNATAGINFSSKTVLRIGVALLGFRIGFEQITALGLQSALLVTLAVICTIAFGALLARALRQNAAFGILTGGATAICGASAALAISSVLPPDKVTERDTTFAVVAVTTLSTLAMILYPPILALMGTDHTTSGFMIGATVHDVAQVVGAGYMISPEAGDLATVTKLFRVALLVPVTAALAYYFSLRNTASNISGSAPLPWFLVLFVMFVIMRSLNIVPENVVTATTEASRWCLCTAIAAVGLKTSLGDFREIGLKAVWLVIAETLFLIALVAGGYHLI